MVADVRPAKEQGKQNATLMRQNEDGERLRKGEGAPWARGDAHSGSGDPQAFELSVKGGLVNTKGPGGGCAIVAVCL